MLKNWSKDIQHLLFYSCPGKSKHVSKCENPPGPTREYLGTDGDFWICALLSSRQHRHNYIGRWGTGVSYLCPGHSSQALLTCHWTQLPFWTLFSFSLHSECRKCRACPSKCIMGILDASRESCSNAKYSVNIKIHKPVG